MRRIPAVLLSSFSSLLMLCLIACKPSKPQGVMSEGKMQNVLVDYHLAQGMAENMGGNREENQYMLVQAVFRKHHITEAQFDTSLIYYSTHSEVFAKMYKVVNDRIEARANAMGVDAEPQSIYSHLSDQGDTANIWVERPLIALRPTQMDNIYIFSLRADSTFRPGDSFLWHFRSRYVLQGNNREAFAQLVVHYENDSVEGKSQFIRADAETEVRVDPAKNKDSLQIRSLSGYVYLPISTQDPKVFRLLTLTDIALVRFHKVLPPEKTELADDSLTLDSLEKDTSAISSQPHQRLTPQQMRDAQPRERTINVVKEKAVNPNLRPTRRRNINQPRSNRRRTSP